MLSYLRRRSRLNSVDDYDAETLKQLMTLVRGLLTSHALPLVERSPALLSLYRKVQIRIAVLMKMGMLSRDRFYRLRAAGHVVRYDKGVPAISKALRKMLETTERCPGNKKEQKAFEKYSVLYYKWWHSAFHTPRFEEDIAEHSRRDEALDILDELLCDMLLHVEAPASSKFKSKKSQSIFGPRRASMENFSDLENEQEKANHYSVHTGQIQNVFAKTAGRQTDLTYGRPGAVPVMSTRTSARDAFALAPPRDPHLPVKHNQHRIEDALDQLGSGGLDGNSSGHTTPQKRNSHGIPALTRRRASDENTGTYRRASDGGRRSLLQPQGGKNISASHSNVSQNGSTDTSISAQNKHTVSFGAVPGLTARRSSSIGTRPEEYGKALPNGVNSYTGESGNPPYKRSSVGESREKRTSASSAHHSGHHSGTYTPQTQSQSESVLNRQSSKEGSAVASVGFAMSAAMGMGIDAMGTIASLAKKTVPTPNKSSSPSKQSQSASGNIRGYAHGYQEPQTQSGPFVNGMKIEPILVPMQESSRSDGVNTNNRSQLGTSQSLGVTSLTGRSNVADGSASNSNNMLNSDSGNTSQSNSSSVLYERESGSGKEDGGTTSTAKKIMTVLRHSSMTGGLGVSGEKKREKEREKEREEEGEMGFKTDARASVSVEQQQPNLTSSRGNLVVNKYDGMGLEGSEVRSTSSIFSVNEGEKKDGFKDTDKDSVHSKYHGSEHRKNRWKNRVMRSLAKRKSGAKEQQKRNMAPRGTVWGPRPGILLTTPQEGEGAGENTHNSADRTQTDVGKAGTSFPRRRSSLT